MEISYKVFSWKSTEKAVKRNGRRGNIFARNSGKFKEQMVIRKELPVIYSFRFLST